MYPSLENSTTGIAGLCIDALLLYSWLSSSSTTYDCIYYYTIWTASSIYTYKTNFVVIQGKYFLSTSYVQTLQHISVDFYFEKNITHVGTLHFYKGFISWYVLTETPDSRSSSFGSFFKSFFIVLSAYHEQLLCHIPHSH